MPETRVTEASEERITESGETRILELIDVVPLPPTDFVLGILGADLTPSAEQRRFR